ncbi:hypothetical protein F444_23009 [Phytophthora nicotianae P1976]|uniref:Uncharacterized protein n=1 Tax=Phytophthora nicotianae P1976 TaxID=1317066 RepID=A0A080YW52_PHYNI|nr:hypothetical protein F444_23009 [Phytophthora nicotianae P1976]
MPAKGAGAKKAAQKKTGTMQPVATGKRVRLTRPKDYVSPLEKRRRAAKPERIIATVEELQAYIKGGQSADESVTIYARFLWDSYHVAEDTRDIVHLHLYDAVAEDDIETLLKNFHYEGEHDFGSDRMLMTASIWDTKKGCRGIPKPGEFVRISHFTGLKLYRDETVQFNTKLSDIRVDDPYVEDSEENAGDDSHVTDPEI